MTMTIIQVTSKMSINNILKMDILKIIVILFYYVQFGIASDHASAPVLVVKYSHKIRRDRSVGPIGRY